MYLKSLIFVVLSLIFTSLKAQEFDLKTKGGLREFLLLSGEFTAFPLSTSDEMVYQYYINNAGFFFQFKGGTVSNVRKVPFPFYNSLARGNREWFLLVQKSQNDSLELHIYDYTNNELLSTNVIRSSLLSHQLLYNPANAEVYVASTSESAILKESNVLEIEKPAKVKLYNQGGLLILESDDVSRLTFLSSDVVGIKKNNKSKNWQKHDLH